MVTGTHFLKLSIHKINYISITPLPRRAHPSLKPLPSRAPNWTCLVKGAKRRAAVRTLDETSPAWPDPGMVFTAGSGSSGRFAGRDLSGGRVLRHRSGQPHPCCLEQSEGNTRELVPFP